MYSVKNATKQSPMKREDYLRVSMEQPQRMWIKISKKALEGDAAISCRPADLIDEKFSDINEEFIKSIKKIV